MLSRGPGGLRPTGAEAQVTRGAYTLRAVPAGLGSCGGTGERARKSAEQLERREAMSRGRRGPGAEGRAYGAAWWGRATQLARRPAESSENSFMRALRVPKKDGSSSVGRDVATSPLGCACRPPPSTAQTAHVSATVVGMQGPTAF